MGAAQFMSDTWWGYKDDIADATGNNPPNPWDLLDGVVAMALKLNVKFLTGDKGFEGLVILMGNREIKTEGVRLIAESGALSILVAHKAARAELTGFEWAASLPGTIGGAVRGNSGCFGGELKDVFEVARVLDPETLEIHELLHTDCQFGYRDSGLKESKKIIWDVTLKLVQGDPTLIKTKMDEVITKRKASQPLSSGMIGCAFKNAPFESEDRLTRVKEVAGEIPENFLQKHQLGSGWIIDKLGLKGTKIGGMSVSENHGNFLINDGTATADQMVQLLSLIKMKARDELGVQLQEEIEYIGF